ncbi:hypothetical protein KAJ27_15305, partial [bacterium]|nr:hypothetical protein [bacterium]
MVMKTIDLLKTILILFFVCLLGGEIAFADWVGPVEVVSGKWGKGHGEFGFASTSEDWFPRFFNVNNKDEIFIFDEINKAIHKFNNKGDLLDNNLETGSFLIHPNGNILITGKTTNRFFYNESGDLVSTVDIKHEDPFVGENGYWFIETIYKNNKYSIKYHLYSLKGDYIGNFSKETIKSLPDKIKRHNNDTLIVEYNDGIVYEFKVDNVQKISDIYFRDKYKSFYILETHLKPYWKDYTVYQKNICSNDIRKLAMPEGNVHLQ